MLEISRLLETFLFLHIFITILRYIDSEINKIFQLFSWALIGHLLLSQLNSILEF